jgi:hypothetical protein
MVMMTPRQSWCLQTYTTQFQIFWRVFAPVTETESRQRNTSTGVAAADLYREGQRQNGRFRDFTPNEPRVEETEGRKV